MQKIIQFAMWLILVPFITWADPTVYVGSISGDVEPAMAAYVERMIEISDQPDAVLILKMDTFGGRVDAGLKIVDTLTRTRYVKTIAYVTDKAISAGALIALACDSLYMRPHTTIGDCAPIIYDTDGPQMLGEKFQSPLRAKFRSLAKKNGYPPLLAEAMVSSEKAVYQIIDTSQNVKYIDQHAFNDLTETQQKDIVQKRTIVPKGELLTMDDTEAYELGFSKLSANSISDIQGDLSLDNYQIINIEETWSEKMVRGIYSISSILLLIGMAAMYMELKSPGFGLFGIVGLIFLGIVFFAQYFVGLSDHLELLLIGLAIILMGFEIFVFPGFGISGLSAIGCIAVALILSFQDFVIPSPDMPWEGQLMVNNSIKVLGTAVLAWILSIVLFRLFIPRTAKIVSGPYLNTSLANAHSTDKSTIGLDIGDTGIARSPLRPSGKMTIGRNIFDVVSQGEFIPKGSDVRVIHIKGSRVIVKQL
ncbi:MAG: membrane-bound serine protease (ClpP class) [Candidatus Magnetoglobus multicellularis str. Araruama]|uniref:Membrane-bound serine protease (ClpP class) n=1 Tax=Candidatus Magnetoglobus multicellularis str. Araruama TaxID=890399 RepID=A0A1V1P8Y1_9BACT|nr:MAG: membrane-bound serine protease (ClpP class) [Candidatus Magnetoglobus multicellularis str. Araruama]